MLGRAASALQQTAQGKSARDQIPQTSRPERRIAALRPRRYAPEGSAASPACSRTTAIRCSEGRLVIAKNKGLAAGGTSAGPPKPDRASRETRLALRPSNQRRRAGAAAIVPLGIGRRTRRTRGCRQNATTASATGSCSHPLCAGRRDPDSAGACSIRGRTQVPELARDAGVRQRPRLYGLHEARAAMRQRGFVCLSSRGYMDVVALASSASQRRGHARHGMHGGARAKLFQASPIGGLQLRRRRRRTQGGPGPRPRTSAAASDTTASALPLSPAGTRPRTRSFARKARRRFRADGRAGRATLQLVEVAREAAISEAPKARRGCSPTPRPCGAPLPDGALAPAGGRIGPAAAGLPARRAGRRRRPAARRIGTAPQPDRSIRRAHRHARRRQPRRPRAAQAAAHSQWWDALEPSDHELLHAFPAHGELCAWLERH